MKSKKALVITMLLASIQFLSASELVIIEKNPENPAYIIFHTTRFKIRKSTLPMNEQYKTLQRMIEHEMDKGSSVEEIRENHKGKIEEIEQQIKTQKKIKIQKIEGIIIWDITEAMERLKAKIDNNALKIFLELTAGKIQVKHVTDTLVLAKVIMLAHYFQNTLMQNDLMQKLDNQITEQDSLDFLEGKGKLWNITTLPPFIVEKLMLMSFRKSLVREVASVDSFALKWPMGNIVELHGRISEVKYKNVFKNLTFQQGILVLGLYFYRITRKKKHPMTQKIEQIFKTLPKNLQNVLFDSRARGWIQEARETREASEAQKAQKAREASEASEARKKEGYKKIREWTIPAFRKGQRRF